MRRVAILMAGVLAVVGSGFVMSPSFAAAPHPLDRPEAEEARRALVAVTHDTDPDAAYEAFNAFARTHFGAEAEPLVYELFGDELTLIDEGTWRYVSENSASLAWQTNLPAVSYVEYGPTPEYGMTTPPTERPFYLHLHYLTGLEAGKTYHYRLVAIDERGRKLVTPDQTLTPGRIAGAVYLPGDFDGPPYWLIDSDVTYVLTQDLVVPGGAIIARGDRITLDLNGHTITFATDPDPGAVNAGIEVRGDGRSPLGTRATGVRVVNGTIVQGRGAALASNTARDRYNCLVIEGGDIEVAGVTCIYHAPQAWGATLQNAFGEVTIHHNVFLDKGTQITDRHGAGVRPFGFVDPRERENQFELHHNLVKRTRQNGLHTARWMHHNEVYVDSWSTNSFALQPLSLEGVPAGRYHDNKVFATGFNSFGFGWAHEDLDVFRNFIHVHGLNVRHRWHENWGDINTHAGMRVTNYAPGGQVRNNLRYWENTIVLRGHSGAELRGVSFYSDESIAGLLFERNRVKAESFDDETRIVAAVDVQGYPNKPESLPVVYVDNTFEGNRALIRFGDAYGVGHNHHFIRPKFVRLGEHPDFHTFVFDGGHYSQGHLIIDAEFGPGTAYNDVYWERTASTSWYSVGWTLELSTVPGAHVSIQDRTGREVFQGEVGPEGVVSVPLIQSTIRPTEWNPRFELLVLRKDRHIEEEFTPHTVTVTAGGKTVSQVVDMRARRQLTLIPE